MTRPYRSTNLLFVSALLVLFNGAQALSKTVTRDDFGGPLIDGTPAKPMSYKDVDMGITLYVESDGQHVAAIAASGKLLWVRNPFADARLPLYRYKHPVIFRLSAEPHWSPNAYPAAMHLTPYHQVVHVEFNNSQFGVLNLSNGDFAFMGQN